MSKEKKSLAEYGVSEGDQGDLLDLWCREPWVMVEDCIEEASLGAPAFHLEIYGMLREARRVLLMAPRGHGKSSICSYFYPLWSALYGVRKNIHIISASEAVALEFLRKIKTQLETNVIIMALFGPQDSKKWTEKHVILKNGVSITARGAGSQSRGPRPDLIILDDIEDEESVVSEDRRKKMREWLFKACINSVTPDGQVVWIGTPINHLCLIYEYFVGRNAWTKRRFQALVKDEPLWPELWSLDALRDKKLEIGETFFATEYMCDPLCDESLPIKPHMIREWDVLPKTYNLYMTVDPAYSEEETSDYKTCALIAVDGNNNRYLVKYIHMHGTLNDFLSSIITLYLENKGTVVAIGVPNSGTEKSFFNQLANEFQRRNVYPPLHELKNVYTTASGISIRNKFRRNVAALQPLFQQGRYYLHNDHTEAREELLGMGISKHDDIVDCLAYAEQIVQPHIIKEEIEVVDIVPRETFRMVGTSGYGI